MRVTRFLAAPCLLWAAWALADGDTKTCAVYSEEGAGNVPLYRFWEGPAWSVPSSANALAGDIEWLTIRNCPARDELALLSLGADNQLDVQIWDGSAWGSVSALVTGTPPSSQRVYGAGYEGDSGDLLVVYGKDADLNLHYRTYSGGWSGESSFDIGLGGAPTRVTLAARADSDEMVVLASSDSRLCGAVWDGSAFGSSITLDNNVDGTQPAGGRRVSVEWRLRGRGVG